MSCRQGQGLEMAKLVQIAEAQAVFQGQAAADQRVYQG